MEHTVLSSEQSSVSTTCLSGHVVMQVIAFTPCTGSRPRSTMSVENWSHQQHKGNPLDGMYIAFPVNVSSKRTISHRLFSISLFDPIVLLHPTPLCQIEQETLFFAVASLGIVNPVQNSISNKVLINSSASGFATTESFPRGGAPSCSSPVCASSNNTSPPFCGVWILSLRAVQKNLSSQSSSRSVSQMKGSNRVRMRIQLSASRSGASSGSGNEGWFLRATRREITARINVSTFASSWSRARRMSAGVNRLKTSSVDSGSSQNYTMEADRLATI